MKLGRRNGREERLKQFARRIEEMARKDEQRLREAQQIQQLRLRAAAELHALCAGFVRSVNALLPRPMLELSPAEWSEAFFRDSAANVFQIAMAGRILHLEFQAPESLISTERFRTPYVLEGALRAFNQEMLDLAVVPEKLLFCCLEGGKTRWVWFDPRTQRSAPLDEEHLIGLFERLL
jgi:hypothetical protein